MKKHQISLLLMLLFTAFALLPQPAGAYMVYQNPGRIILTTPQNGAKTSAAHISLLGACDWQKPLYLNGQPLQYTEHGFFAAYVDLKPGQNTITLKQGEQTKSITVTRTGGGSGGSSAQFSWDKLQTYKTPIWGEVKADNITHRRLPDGSQHLLNALAKGTPCRLIGEWGNYYCLADKTFVLKSSIRQISAPQAANITSITVTPRTAQNCTELNLRIGRGTLYKVDLGANALTVTLYDTACSARPVYTDNPLFSDITISDTAPLTLTLPLKQNARAFGYYTEQRGDHLVFGFKLPPQITAADITDERLDGAVVLLDAGHGGTDGGASGPPGAAGPMEKNINLMITNYAKERLEALGATVIMARSDDTAVSLADRVTQILAAKPDLSISIHSNSIDASADYTKTGGFRAYYTYDTAEAAVKLVSDQVSVLAAVNQTTPVVSNLALTRIENCPAILLENAFMSSPTDYERMIQSDYQQRFGNAVAEAAAAYLRQNANAAASAYPISDLSQAVLSDKSNQPIRVFLDGEQLSFDVDPLLQNDVTLVPLRTVFEALQATVNWNADQSVTAKRDNTTLRLTLNQNLLSITENGETREVSLIAPAIAQSGRVLVPLRAISEGFGCTVDWEGAERAVVIRTFED